MNKPLRLAAGGNGCIPVYFRISRCPRGGGNSMEGPFANIGTGHDGL